MDALREPPAEDVARLRDCINDLVSIMAQPAQWTGGDSDHASRVMMFRWALHAALIAGQSARQSRPTSHLASLRM